MISPCTFVPNPLGRSIITESIKGKKEENVRYVEFSRTYSIFQVPYIVTIQNKI